MGNNTQVAIADKVQGLRAFLERGKKQLELSLSKHMSADRMLRFALTAATQNPTLFECSPESVGLALMKAGSIGLEPDGVHAHLVPYRDNKSRQMVCQLIPDYKGLVRLARASKDVLSFECRAVYEADEFSYEYGSNAHLRHKPANVEKRGKLTHAYAFAELRDAKPAFSVLTAADVEKRRAVSKMKSAGPWQLWPEEMWAKTAAKHLCKTLPIGGQFEDAVAHDNEIESIKATIDVPSLPAGDGPRTLSDLGEGDNKDRWASWNDEMRKKRSGPDAEPSSVPVESKPDSKPQPPTEYQLDQVTDFKGDISISAAEFMLACKEASGGKYDDVVDMSASQVEMLIAILKGTTNESD